ncbi:MAG: hypothetical protein VW270_04475 [Candidatus Poseidoniales archaeon]
MKIKIDLDLTPEEAKELFVPSEKSNEFYMLLYDAYTKAVHETLWKHIDPNDMMGFRKDK